MARRDYKIYHGTLARYREEQVGGVRRYAISDRGVTTPKIEEGALTAETSVGQVETSPITTTSTAYVEVADLTQTVVVPDNAKLLVLFRSNVNNNTDGRSVDTLLQIDGVDHFESRFTSSTANSTGNNANLHLVTFPTGKSVTVKVFWRVSAGTGTMRTRQLYILTLKR